MNNTTTTTSAFDAESNTSSPMLFHTNSRNNWDDDDLLSDEDAAYQLQLQERQEREAQQNAAAESNRGPTILHRYAKRAIVKRIEHARQEQVAARASELLVQEQARRRKARAGSPVGMQAAASFFCRTTSYGEYDFQESGAFGSPSVDFGGAMERSMGAFPPPALSGGGGGPPSVDVTFGALVDELKEAMPKSGMPTPDIALVMDRFLSPDVPVHFIGSLQRLRQTLRDVTRLSRSIRRHVDQHSDTMRELEEVLDEDAEEEEVARMEIDDEMHRARKANKRKQQQHQQQRRRPVHRRRGLVSDDENAEGNTTNGHDDDDESSITFHLVPPDKKQNEQQQQQKQQESAEPPSDLEQSEGEDDDDDDVVEEEEHKPAWVGNVPRLRTSRPRTELLERMSQLVQKADVHAARVIDDVHKWRRYSHVPQPFFHNGDNAFFILHRRYGAGLAFNRACDLLRRYAAGEVFFYVSPFDFSVSSDDAAADSQSGSMRVAAMQDENMMMDETGDGLFSEASSPTSPLGVALGELKQATSFIVAPSGSFSGSKSFASATANSGGAGAGAGGRSGTAAVGKGGGSGPPDMRDKWKRIEAEAETQNRYLKRTLTQLAGGWYRPVLKVVTELLWERHMYWKQQNEGKGERGQNTGGSYMRFASKGSSSLGGAKNEGFLDPGPAQQQQPTASKRLYKTLYDNTGKTPPPRSGSGSQVSNSSTLQSGQNPFNVGARGRNSSSVQQQQSDPPRTSVASATELHLRLGLDWRFLSAGCFIPIISKDLRQHLIMCCRNGLLHVARHNPGVGATAGTAVQRLIALNASHLARRYLHLWQAALRRRKKLRMQAGQLCVRNIERQRKLRFGTFIKFFNFRNESGRLWRPMLQKVRSSLIRRYMHHLFMNRALNITTRAMRRALYLRYYRMLHFLVVRRRVNGARVTFSQEGDRRKIRGSTAASTKDALRELAAAAALVNPTQGIKLQMERHYASDGDALRVIAETGGGGNCVPSLVQVIAAGRRMLPFRRFHDQHDVERARLLADEFVARRELIFEVCLLNLLHFVEPFKL